MSRSALAQFDWRGWRADVVERLDRRCDRRRVGVRGGLHCRDLRGPGTRWRHELAAFVFATLFNFSTVMVTMAVLAVALVAVARGISVWVAYPAAGLAVAAIGSVLGVVIEANCGCRPRANLHAMVVENLIFLSILCPPAVLYVYASSATYDEKVLRALEAERAAEAERLAQQRLQTELATVDHDLVLRAMRLALTVRAREAAQAEALLEAVTAYLRLAQQRGSSEPGRIAAALAELRQACASRVGEPAQQVIA